MKRLLGRAVRGSCIKIQHVVERWRHHCLWDKQLSFEDANQLVVELLSRRDPFLVGRIGNTEGRIVGEYKFRNARFGRLTKKEAHQNAGMFPVTPEALARFSEIYWSALQSVNLLGFWQADFQSDLLVASSPDIKLAPLASLEPYLHAIPWSSALAGRRVLVVHPFASTIRAQYESRRALLFDNPFVLPIFDLLTLEPPQTLAPLTAGYLNWFDALNDLSELVLKHDFDVALLGCGAYGLPLGASIKAAGRQAIHLGGALQVLFGIRGRRWENMPRIASMMNESWVRPSVEETPPSAAMVEEGCYW